MKTASGHKASKDRVTLLLCSNASGDRMLKPLLINKSLRPRTLKGKDLKQLPVHWIANPKAWMTTAIFTECSNKTYSFKCLLEKFGQNVTDNTTTQTSTLSDEIINLAHEIGGDCFNTFSHNDVDKLLVGDALSDNIIDLTLDLTVDGVVGLEGDNEEEKSTPLTGKLIQEGLQLCSKLENHFLINAPNSERASKLQRELQNCMSGYPELYKKNKRILIAKFNY
ncbi:uncharacterized protein TNCV_912171 [Trichonephila clavipes]|nr:uncharacterized protein TNCV_912171 [Trichonephila clavipes]